VRARRAALDTLAAVAERDAYANLVLPGLLRSRGLTGPEAARATDLTYGTLRGQGTYDQVISACSSRALTRIDPAVLDALRLGTHQLLFGRVPAHAAVATTVDLVRQRSGAGSARFANAVLRAISQRSLDEWVEALLGEDAPERDRLAMRHLHPRWIVDALADALGEQAERLPAVLEANNLAPRVTLAALPGLSTVDELVAAGARAGRWSPTAAVAPPGDPRAVAAVAQGRARVQDEGSQVVTAALVAAPAAEGGDRAWLDVCAGPGGKASLLGALGAGSGTPLLAADIHQHRARLVSSAIAAAGLGEAVTVVRADGTHPPWRPQRFSRVLLDAPCTGLGALRRRPEARWRRSPADLERLAPLQRALLHRALDSTAPDGVVAYVTCSPHRAETADVVEAVLAERGDVVLGDAAAVLHHIPAVGRGPYAQLWPDLHGTDAMFLALLVRRRRVG
jgi:16S rRNA (cytosine967-C5)-methyltransferase